MKRRNMLTSLLGLAATPAVAARVLAEPPTLFGFPIFYGQHIDPIPTISASGGYLVPEEFRDEILRMLAVPPEIVEGQPEAVAGVGLTSMLI